MKLRNETVVVGLKVKDDCVAWVQTNSVAEVERSVKV